MPHEEGREPRRAAVHGQVRSWRIAGWGCRPVVAIRSSQPDDRQQEPPRAPAADPAAIRACLSPEVAAVFDAEEEHVLDAAKRSKDLAGVDELLAKWRHLAYQELREPGDYFRVLAAAAHTQATGSAPAGSGSPEEMRAHRRAPGCGPRRAGHGRLRDAGSSVSDRHLPGGGRSGRRAARSGTRRLLACARTDRQSPVGRTVAPCAEPARRGTPLALRHRRSGSGDLPRLERDREVHILRVLRLDLADS
jgi:hypothetical protein